MTTIRVLFSCILLLCFTSVKAQFDAQFSQYWAVTGYYNPAYAGQQDKLNIAGAYSMQLAGFTNAPKSMFFAADMPLQLLGKKHGVGVNFFNEGIGLFKNQSFFAQYAYKLKLWKGQLSLGAQVGGISVSFDPDKLELGENGTDNAFPTTVVNGMGFDVGLGAYYSNPLFYAGISATHLTSPLLKLGENNEISVSPTVYFTAGCNIKTKSPLVSIQPSMLLKSDFVATKLDVTARLLYTYQEKIFYGGLSYSPANSVSFLIGAKIKDVTVGYAYEMFTSKIGIGSGSHDLFVTYSMDINLSGNNKNKHKSIRIL